MINIFFIFLTIFFLFFIFMRHFFRSPTSLTGKHILITGGSSGIGKALAIEAAHRGANITIIARNKEKLEAAKKEIEANFVLQTQRAASYSLDVVKEVSKIKEAINDCEDKLGPIFMLVNCAGVSISYKFEDTPLHEFQNMLDANYLSAVFTTQQVLPKMKQRKEGHIIFVSSLAGVFGLFGYTAYSGSKFALVGLAECLTMEVKPFNIKVTVSLPPDTDTPGFALEEKIKPTETRKISESGGLYSPDVVAKKILNDALVGKFFSTLGAEGWLLETVCSGMSPPNSLWHLLSQVFTIGITRLIAGIYLKMCDKTILECQKKNLPLKQE